MIISAFLWYMISDCFHFQEKQPFERIEVSRDQALEMFSDNKFKASTAALFFLTSPVLSFVLHNHDSEPYFLLSSCGNKWCCNYFGYWGQVEIINDLPADKTITVYRCGPLVDLCRGPHIPNTSFVKALACLKVYIGVLSCLIKLLPCSFVLSIYLHQQSLSCYCNSRLHQHIGEGTKTGKVYREFMEYLILIKRVWRWFFFFFFW